MGSPRSGMVHDLFVREGQVVSSGDELYTVGEGGGQPHEIFLAYRSNDVDGHVSRLVTLLEQEFSRYKVFVDYKSLEPGLDYERSITGSLNNTAKVLILVIGSRWLHAVDSTGRKRLDNENDLHRREIAIAFSRAIPILPILVQGTTMPHADELPREIALVSRSQALPLANDRWDYDSRRILDAVHRLYGR
jgi:pyruvate/2-oxoglutarate dehydrogenase complex dihydrolipoamide acyltransferase (E2) component